MVADTNRLAQLGFQAKYSLKEGLQQYVEWLVEQDRIPEYFTDAEEYLKNCGVVRSVKNKII